MQQNFTTFNPKTDIESAIDFPDPIPFDAPIGIEATQGSNSELKQGLLESISQFATQSWDSSQWRQSIETLFARHKIPANRQEVAEFLTQLTEYMSKALQDTSKGMPLSQPDPVPLAGGSQAGLSQNNKGGHMGPPLPQVNLSEILSGQRLMSQKGYDLKETAWLQDNLREWGYKIEDQQGKYRGVFGPQTERAVRDFQKMAGLEVDGIVGPKTLNALIYRQPVKLPEGIGLKKGAVIHSLHPKIVATFPHIQSVWKQFKGPKPVITSGNDSRHVKNSKHYQNRAIDLRGRNVSDHKLRQMGEALQQRLGKDYLVLVELYPERPSNDHIHVQYNGEWEYKL